MEPLSVTPLEQQQLRVAGEAGDTFWHRVRFRLVRQAAARSGARSVLDIGAGSGQLGDWLARHAPHLDYSFDEVSPVLDAALAAHFGEQRRSSPTAPIVPTTLVTMLDVLEHIEDDAVVLRSIADRMEPGAQLLLTVPALQWAFTSWDTSLGHHRRYSKRQVRELAAATGLDVSSVSYLFPELMPLVLVRKLRRHERSHADFPHVPRVIDVMAEAASVASAVVRRIWPVGTSVVAVLTRPDPAQP